MCALHSHMGWMAELKKLISKLTYLYHPCFSQILSCFAWSSPATFYIYLSNHYHPFFQDDQTYKVSCSAHISIYSHHHHHNIWFNIHFTYWRVLDSFLKLTSKSIYFWSGLYLSIFLSDPSSSLSSNVFLSFSQSTDSVTATVLQPKHSHPFFQCGQTNEISCSAHISLYCSDLIFLWDHQI